MWQSADRGNKDHAEALSNLGRLLSKEGNLSEAGQLLERALELAPKTIESHYALAPLKRYSAEDPQAQALEEIARSTANLTEKERIQLYFTLGKMREDLGNYPAAFAAFEQGNSLRKSQLKVDDSQWEKLKVPLNWADQISARE